MGTCSHEGCEAETEKECGHCGEHCTCEKVEAPAEESSESAEESSESAEKSSEGESEEAKPEGSE